LRTVPPANANADITGGGSISAIDFHALAADWLQGVTL
jgi:hypothetical protein